MNSKTRLAALEHAKAEFPREACGLIIVFKGREQYIPCRNIAVKNCDFIIHPDDYAKADGLGEIMAVVHSHCYVGPEPSQADVVSCEASGLPWHIVSLPNETWAEIKPSGYKAPLIGREYSYGILDCYTLVRDWYLEEMQITLPDFDRSVFEWWKTGGNLYMDNFEKAGFKKVPIETLRRGDGILMKIKSPVINHAAVYLGDDLILHHLQNRLSGRDIFGGWFANVATQFIVRHEGK